MILAIDPGTTHSGYVMCDTSPWEVLEHGIVDNERIVSMVDRQREGCVFVIEQFVSRYQRIGNDSVTTIEWQGRFMQTAMFCDGCEIVMMPRKTAAEAVCDDRNASDSAIRMALIDRFGGKAKAIGLKKSPGPLHGIKKDEWAALALAVAYSMRMGEPARAEVEVRFEETT